MTPAEQRAWARLTADMAGGAHQYDYWEDVPAHVQQRYLNRDLIDRAARAHGIELVWSSEPDLAPRRKDTWDAWNPRDNDGDALRLAAHLKIDLEWNSPGGVDWVDAYHRSDNPVAHMASHPAADYRLAIVEVAAAMAPEAS